MAAPEGYQSPFIDDASIDANQILYRRINAIWIDWHAQLAGGPGLTRQAFQTYTAAKANDMGYPAPGMSVGSSVLLQRHGVEPVEMLAVHGDSYGLVGLSVERIRQVSPSLGIVSMPTDTEPWHAMVFPETRATFNKPQSGQLRDCVVELLAIPAEPSAQ